LLGWTILIGSAVVFSALGWLAGSIIERRAERAVNRVQMLQPIGDWETDNAKWAVNFPREYNSWERTKDIEEATKYGGSATRDYLENDPRLVVLFAGFAFGKDYNSPRGHYHSVHDVTSTKRVSDKTPATCWTCKSPMVPKLMHEKGVAAFYAGKFKPLEDVMKDPIGCLDCHDPRTMALRISRPALKEAFERRGRDITKASHQEMRSLVCAQCHVSYYFKDKKSNYLIFPWDDGFTADDFDRYFEKKGFVEWIHPISGTRMTKMRHPDYELWLQGTHAFRDVSCADCHMPYKAEGGVKFTDHQIRSPLYNIANSCQVCHRWSESEVKQRVESIQDKNRELLNIAEDAMVKAHITLADAMKLGATDAELEAPRTLLRRSHTFWDYIAASNGMGFHAPQESARVLAKAANLAQESRLATERVRARHGAQAEAAMPDLSTKAKAAAYVKPFIDAQEAAKKAQQSKPAGAP
jgi:nitrite reductase (cytochrome c-552)